MYNTFLNLANPYTLQLTLLPTLQNMCVYKYLKNPTLKINLGSTLIHTTSDNGLMKRCVDFAIFNID
jgi:hypothetical protein